MADASRKPAFEVVDDDEPLAPLASPSDPAAKIGTSMLLLGLKALSQRAAGAVKDLFTLVSVGSAFWLFFAIKTDPNTYQLVLAATYALFVLAANWIVRRG